MFLVVLVFFKEAADLLQILSGRSLISKPVKTYTSQLDDQKKFIKLSQEAFFKPRWRPGLCPCPAFSALMSVAQLFTELGYLKSIDEVKHYLVTAAPVSKLLFPSQPGMCSQVQGGLPCRRSIQPVRDVGNG